MKRILCWLAVALLVFASRAGAEEAWIIDNTEAYPTPEWVGKGVDILLDTMPLYVDAHKKTYTLELWGTEYPGFQMHTHLDDALIKDGDAFVQQLSLGIDYWAIDDKFVVYVDANFDGYRDLMFCNNAVRDISHYQYWLWSPMDDKFIMSESFTNMAGSRPVFYPEAKRIGCYEGFQVYHYVHGYLYEVVGDTLVLVKEVEKTSDDDQMLGWSDIEGLLLGD
jgi:hypothetical protein